MKIQSIITLVSGLLAVANAATIFTGVISSMASINNISTITARFEPSMKAEDVIGVSRTGNYAITLPAPTSGEWSKPRCHMIVNADSRIVKSHALDADIRYRDGLPVIEGGFSFAGSPDYRPFIISCVINTPYYPVYAPTNTNIAPDASGKLTKMSNADIVVNFDNPRHDARADPDYLQIVEVLSFGELAESIDVFATGSLSSRPYGLEVRVTGPRRRFHSLALDGFSNINFGPFSPVSASYGYIANCTMQNGEFRYGLRANFDTDEPRYLDFQFLDGTVVEGDVHIVCPKLSAEKIFPGVNSVVSVFANYTEIVETKTANQATIKEPITYTYQTSSLIRLRNNAFVSSFLLSIMSVALAIFVLGM